MTTTTTTRLLPTNRKDVPPTISVEKNPHMPAMTSAQSPPCIPKQDMFLADSMADNKMDSAEASPSDVLSQALDIVDISCGVVDNKKQASSIASGRPRRSSPPITARRAGPVNATNATSSFPAKVVAYHHSSMSKSTVQISSIGTHPASTQTRPKLVRLNSTDSCSTTTTVSTTASFVSSSSSTVSSTVSSPSNSPISSPKRSIFQSYWDKKGTPSRQTNTVSFSNVPQVSSSSEDLHPAQQTQDQDEPSTLDGSTAATTTTKSATSGEQPSTPRSATVTLPEGYQHSGTTASASPKRSIFGNRAMETAKRSSLPDLPSIAATLITESDFSSTGASNSYTDYHRVHHVRKTSSTDHLVKVRKSCLRRVSLYSPSSTGTPGKEMKKSASAISTTATTNLQPTRPRASTLPQPVVQFDPQVRVYEFHRSVEDSHHHHNHASSNDWSHLFA